MFSNTHINFLHTTPVQIRFNDIDISGHVNNTMYFQYLDYARLQYFKEVFQDTIEWRKKGFVLAKIDIDFFEPIFLEDNISVKTKIIKIGIKSIEMKQQIVKYSNKNKILRVC